MPTFFLVVPALTFLVLAIHALAPDATRNDPPMLEQIADAMREPSL